MRSLNVDLIFVLIMVLMGHEFGRKGVAYFSNELFTLNNF